MVHYIVASLGDISAAWLIILSFHMFKKKQIYPICKSLWAEKKTRHKKTMSIVKDTRPEIDAPIAV